MTDLTPTWLTATAAGIGGLAILGLGIAGAARPDSVGPLWFVLAGLAAELLAVGVVGLRRAASDVRGTRVATAVAAAATAVFGLAHFATLIDEEAAIAVFSAVSIVVAAGLIVAGVAVAGAARWSAARRFVPLLTGVWPVATIPVGAVLGDVPHFLAIAGWGACWIALGLVLLDTRTVSRATATP
jgi:hypothetical protein